MPWKEATPMSLREEMIGLTRSRSITMAQLARRCGISRKTAYKWVQRAADGEPLSDRTRRPLHSPGRTDPAVEQAILAARRRYPAWGARKLERVLRNEGVTGLPAVSTITAILRRHGLIEPAAQVASQHWHRFEHPQPNDLWQMDFKGTIHIGARRCDPLTVLDDHSRFNLVLRANRDMTRQTVQQALTETFRIYGLPHRMNMDNGSPWANGKNPAVSLSHLAIWLIRLGIHVSYSGPFHPQTNGKDERFHRSLKAEVLSRHVFDDFEHAQTVFDRWRLLYNTIRPHQAIDMAVPADRYRPSPRAFPHTLPSPEYAPQDTVLRVRGHGRLYFKGTLTPLSMALSNQYVAVRPRDTQDSLYDVYFGHHHVTVIDLNQRDNL